MPNKFQSHELFFYLLISGEALEDLHRSNCYVMLNEETSKFKLSRLNRHVRSIYLKNEIKEINTEK